VKAGGQGGEKSGKDKKVSHHLHCFISTNVIIVEFHIPSSM
jgi:hypothetical protein